MQIAVQEHMPQRQEPAHYEQSDRSLILLVDDEPMMQELGKDLLEENGYHVMLASDGIEALALYRQHAHEIDLVILDILMPGLDGGRTYGEMKKINEKVKAFFCTGYTPTEVIGALLKGQSLLVLQKPFRTLEFIQTVRDVLAS